MEPVENSQKIFSHKYRNFPKTSNTKRAKFYDQFQKSTFINKYNLSEFYCLHTPMPKCIRIEIGINKTTLQYYILLSSFTDDDVNKMNGSLKYLFLHSASLHSHNTPVITSPYIPYFSIL